MSQATPEQLQALDRLWQMAHRDHGGARVAATLLLGCYNGARFPFDLTDLRLLDGPTLSDCMAVLVMDSSPQREVHEHLNALYGRADMGMRFELLAHDWRLKGRCRKDELQQLAPLIDESAGR